jgi:hypothetical protein
MDPQEERVHGKPKGFAGMEINSRIERFDVKSKGEAAGNKSLRSAISRNYIGKQRAFSKPLVSFEDVRTRMQNDPSVQEAGATSGQLVQAAYGSGDIMSLAGK